MRNLRTLFVISFGLLVWSCSEPEEAVVNNEPVADFDFELKLDELLLKSKSSDPDKEQLKLQWTSSSSQLSFPNTTSANISVSFPESPLEVDITLTACDSRGLCNSIGKTINLPALTHTRKAGLGIQLSQEKNNDVDYNWYLDQANSNPFNSINCGPASVTMAIAWAKPGFSKTINDARSTYRSEGGWWYTSDIINYLNDNGVENYVIPLTSMNSIVSELDNDNIVILCLDMYYVQDETNSKWRVDKFYKTNAPNWGHFIVAKGYKIVDGTLFFEVYDPYSFSNTYGDGQLKGKNRYYRSSDLNTATGIWWDYAIVVTKNSTHASRQATKDIPHMPGR